MNITSSHKTSVQEASRVNWAKIMIALISITIIAVIAFTAYNAIAADGISADVGSDPAVGMDTGGSLAVNPELKAISNTRQNPRLRTAAERQFARRYHNQNPVHMRVNPTARTQVERQFAQRYLVQNPELKTIRIAGSGLYSRTQAELQFAQRYLAQNPELKLTSSTRVDPCQRTLVELQFAQRYEK